MDDLFGRVISDGAISNILARAVLLAATAPTARPAAELPQSGGQSF